MIKKETNNTTSVSSQKEGKKAGYQVELLGNRCFRCGHEWIPRDIEERPAVCPKCKSPYWYKPRKKLQKNRKISENSPATHNKHIKKE